MKEQNDFAARLARIQENRGGASLDRPQPSLSENELYGVRQDKKSHLVRNSLIWAAIVFGAAFGGYYGAKSLVGEENLTLASLGEGFTSIGATAGKMLETGGGGVALIGSGSRKDDNLPKELEDQGWIMRSPSVATNQDTQIEVTQVLAGLDQEPSDPVLGAINIYDANSACTLRGVRDGEKLVNVRLEYGSRTAPISVFSDETLAHAVTDAIRGVVHRKPYLQNKRPNGDMHVIDVVVTDTTAPQYLVLQNLYRNVLWNIHAAEGVTIAHVAMIGHDSGLVAHPGIKSFEGIRVADFVSGHEFGIDDEIRECMVRPWRKPEDHWPAVAKAANDNDLFENQMHTIFYGASGL